MGTQRSALSKGEEGVIVQNLGTSAKVSVIRNPRVNLIS